MAKSERSASADTAQRRINRLWRQYSCPARYQVSLLLRWADACFVQRRQMWPLTRRAHALALGRTMFSHAETPCVHWAGRWT